MCWCSVQGTPSAFHKQMGTSHSHATVHTQFGNLCVDSMLYEKHFLFYHTELFPMILCCIIAHQVGLSSFAYILLPAPPTNTPVMCSWLLAHVLQRTSWTLHWTGWFGRVQLESGARQSVPTHLHHTLH